MLEAKAIRVKDKSLAILMYSSLVPKQDIAIRFGEGAAGKFCSGLFSTFWVQVQVEDQPFSLHADKIGWYLTWHRICQSKQRASHSEWVNLTKSNWDQVPQRFAVIGQSYRTGPWWPTIVVCDPSSHLLYNLFPVFFRQSKVTRLYRPGRPFRIARWKIKMPASSGWA